MNRDLDGMIAEEVFHWKECQVPKDYDGANACVVLTPNGLQDPDIQWPPKGKLHRSWMCPEWSGQLYKAMELANHVGLELRRPYPTDPEVIAGLALEKHRCQRAAAVSAQVVKSTEPLACPFCGHDGAMAEGNSKFCWMKCQRCGAQGPFVRAIAGRPEALRCWNERVSTPSVHA